MSQSPFCSLVLELSFLTAERRTDTSEEEGSSYYHEAFSVHLLNAMVGRLSYPFKDSFVDGLALCCYDPYVQSDWSSAPLPQYGCN